MLIHTIATHFADVFNAAQDVEQRSLMDQISQCRADLRSIRIAISAKPEFENFEDAVSPLPTTTEARDMRSQFDAIANRVGTLGIGSKDDKVTAELKSLKIELEASRVLLGHVDHLAGFAYKVEQCDTALSDLLEHADTYPDQPDETSSSHVPNKSKLPVDQLQDRLDFCEREVDSLHAGFALVGDDERALGERARVMEMWEDVADSARQKITSARSSSPKNPPSSKIRALLPSLPVKPIAGRRSLLRDQSPGTPSPGPETSRARTMSSSSSLKKPFILGDHGKSKLRPTRDRSPSRSSNRSVSGPAAGSSGQSTFKMPTIPSRPHSRNSSRSVSGPLAGTPQYSSPTVSSRQRTMSSTASIRGKLPQLPVQGALAPTAPRRSRVPATTPPTMTRATSPTLSTVSNTSDGSHTKVKPRLASRNDPSTPRARKESTRGRAVSASNLKTPRPPAAKQKKTYVANPKNRLDVAVGAVVNKLPADVTIEPVLDTWKDESGKYWIGDADPKLCFCRILRSQTVMVRVGGGWMELSK